MYEFNSKFIYCFLFYLNMKIFINVNFVVECFFLEDGMIEED